MDNIYGQKDSFRMLGEDDDQLLWLPPPRSSEVELPLNLRSSVSRLGINSSYSSRISSIFSTDSNPEADDDPFDLKRMKSTPAPRSVMGKYNDKIGRLIDIDSDSPNAKEKSDLSSKFLSAIKSLQNDSLKDSSLLSMKLCDSDPFGASPNKNISLTDWDLLKNEAQAIAGDLKMMPNSPCTPNFSKKPKPLDISFLSQEIPHFPLEPIGECQDFGLLDFSPNITSTQKINFDELKLNSKSPAKKDYLARNNHVARPQVGHKPANVQNLVTSSDSKIVSCRPDEEKENDEPNVYNSCPPKQEIFIDDQLEKAIKNIRARPEPLKKSTRQSLQTPLRGGLEYNRRISNAVNGTKGRPLCDKSLLSSTPRAGSQNKANPTPLRMGLATPIKPAHGNHPMSFATPQYQRFTPLKPAPVPTPSSKVASASSVTAKPKGRLSLATPCTPSRLPFPSPIVQENIQRPSQSSTTRTSSGLSTVKPTHQRRSIMGTPVISSGAPKPSLVKAPATSSKLQALKQGSMLRSKLTSSMAREATSAPTLRTSLATQFKTEAIDTPQLTTKPRLSALPKPLKLNASKCPSK